MKNITLFFLLMLGIGFVSTYAQQSDVQIGGSLGQYRQNQGALFDYSDPEAVNIKVAVWGFVKYPGKYIIPSYSSLTDLLSYAGGPSDDSHLDELKLIRTLPDSTQTVIELKYDDILWTEETKSISKTPEIFAGDILVIPGEPRLYFKDYLSISLSIFSAIVSLAILIINISN
ncbi:MAG: SLBB domain-containing protein [Ignavibacteriales bacterium]|nr:SLBB domain-containing protein [Ignavibacteriales bacterium]